MSSQRVLTGHMVEMAIAVQSVDLIRRAGQTLYAHSRIAHLSLIYDRHVFPVDLGNGSISSSDD